MKIDYNNKANLIKSVVCYDNRFKNWKLCIRVRNPKRLHNMHSKNCRICGYNPHICALEMADFACASALFVDAKSV